MYKVALPLEVSLCDLKKELLIKNATEQNPLGGLPWPKISPSASRYFL